MTIPSQDLPHVMTQVGRSMVGRRIGRYRIEALLGRGGLATVWKARDELLGRTVALKVLHEEFAGMNKVRRRFLHEAQTGARLDHPGIAAVYDHGEIEDLVYMALALIDGETVGERVERRLIPVSEAVRIVIAAAEALGYAHAVGVIHRDVTSRNVMVARDGRVFVLDFGLALAVWESRVTTTEGGQMGTPAYMAPEVIRGETADARSDLYGLGVVFYEALTGVVPFPGTEPISIHYAALNLDAAPPSKHRPEVPAGLDRIVLRAMARDPGARHSCAADLAADLRALVPEAPTPAIGEPRSPVALRPWAGADTTGPGEDDPSTRPRPERLYLAVLPFERADGISDTDGADGRLAARLPGVLGAAMAGLAGVQVVAIPEGELPADPRDLASCIGANALLRGTLACVGSQLRVAYTVLDPWRGVQLAGDVLDGSVAQPFELEDRIFASVARTLGLQGAPTRPPGSVVRDPAAGERYLESLGYLRRYDNEASLDGAIRVLEQLLASEGDVALYHAAIARAFLHKHQWTRERVLQARAATACQRACELDPRAPEVLQALGQLHESSGSLAEARAEFEQALGLRPGFLEAMLGLGRVLDAAGQSEAAGDLFRQAAELHSSDWRAYSWLANHEFQLGRYAQAVAGWRRVTELTPDNARGWLNLGSALYRMDRMDEALAAFRASLEIRPNQRAFTNLGTTYYVLGRFDEAVAAFRKQTGINPLDPIGWGNLGNTCRWIPGREAECAFTLDRAIDLGREQLGRVPGDAELWGKLAGWLANRGRDAEAREAIGRALELAPGSPECLVRAGHVHFQLGDREESLRWFRDAVRRGVGTTELRRSIELAPLREDPEFRRILEEGSARRQGQE